MGKLFTFRGSITFLASLVLGVMGGMTFQTPNDSIAMFARSLQHLGMPVPLWLQDPVSDRVVRALFICLFAYIIMHFFVASGFSFRRWWKNREPKYPLPFSGRAKELIGTMMPVGGATIKDGVFELQMGNKITTKEWFNTPVAFRVIAKTNSTNIRLSYVETEVAFNWEVRMDLGVLLIRGGPLKEVIEERVGQVAVNEWVYIDLIYRRDSFTICVDGSPRFTRKADYSQCNRPLSVFTHAYATVHVKSVLYGTPMELAVKPQSDAENIIDAVYGDAMNASRWIRATKKDEPLASRVKYLIAMTAPVRVTNENLEVVDPMPRRLKQLKFKMHTGECFFIRENDYLSFDSAKPCDPF